MYKLLYIDEDQEQIENFLNYIDDTNNNKVFEVISQLPMNDKELMIELIFKINPDVIVCDFLLNENIGALGYNVPYNGVELMEDYLSIRHKFPCFVLTAKDKDAISDSEDVNLVYTKSLMASEIVDTKAKVKFTDRLLKQIEHYKSRIEESQIELAKLIEIRKSGKADFSIENRIIELDDFLEKSIDANNSIPSEFKTLSNSNRLDSILNKVDELLKKIDKDAK
jgi:DNA-binding NarL/FixJ family response regulator